MIDAKFRIKYFTLGIIIASFVIGIVLLLQFFIKPATAIELEEGKIYGNPNAPHFIVEFLDYDCFYCRKLHPVLKQVLAAFPSEIKIVMKHYPPNDKDYAANISAEAAECARDQGKFLEFSDLLFDNRSWVQDPAKIRESLLDFATSLNLDRTSVEACLDSGQKKAVIELNKKEGHRYEIPGTPTIILNAKKFLPHDFESIVDEVKAEIERAKK